jgi:hypothetical protein
VVSSLPAQATRVGSGIAFDETCKRAAVVWRDAQMSFLSIYDLTTGQTVADFPLTTESSVAPRRWLGAGHVLLDDGSLIDAKLGAPVWRYEYASRLIQAAPHPDERFWFLHGIGKDQPGVLAVKALPQPEQLAGTGDVVSPFVATKGLPVAVQVAMTGSSEGPDAFCRRVQGRVEARAKAFGMVPTPNAKAKLKVTAAFQDTGEFAEVRGAYGGTGGREPVKIALKELTGSVVLDDGAGSKPVTLKEFSVDTPAHDNMPLKPGKAPADILQDMQWDNLEGQVDDFTLPAYLSRTPPAVRVSKLEP